MAFFKEKLNLNKIKKSYPNKNIIVLGTAGSGRCDDLIPCICGTMEKVERKKLMKDNGNKMSVAETEFSKLGFYLLEQRTIKIDNKTSYPVIKYARFLDNDKTGYDMVLTFNPSQYCVELEQINSTTVFIEPPLLEAIQARMKELDF